MYIPKILQNFKLTKEETQLLKVDALLKRINSEHGETAALNCNEKKKLDMLRMDMMEGLNHSHYHAEGTKTINIDEILYCQLNHFMDVSNSLYQKLQIVPFDAMVDIILGNNLDEFDISNVSEDIMYKIIMAVPEVAKNVQCIYALLKMVKESQRIITNSGYILEAKKIDEITNASVEITYDDYHSYSSKEYIGTAKFSRNWLFVQNPVTSLQMIHDESDNYGQSLEKASFDLEKITNKLLQLNEAVKIPQMFTNCFVKISKYDEEQLNAYNKNVAAYGEEHKEWEKKMEKIRELQELYNDKEKYPDLPEPQKPEKKLTKYNYVILSKAGEELLMFLDKFLGENAEAEPKNNDSASYREVLRPYIGQELTVTGVVAEIETSDEDNEFVIIRDVYMEDGTTFVCDHMWLYDKNIINAGLEVGRRYKFTGAVKEYKLKDSGKVNVAVYASSCVECTEE